MKDFDKHAERYLLWMAEKGYAASTIANYGYMLKRFKTFIMDKKDHTIFTYKTAVEFREKNRQKIALGAVKGFARYLYNRGVIEAPIEKPTVLLPDVFEQYIDYNDSVKEISKLTVDRIRKVLTAFDEYLEKTDIRLSRLQIEHVDTFLSEINKGYARETCSKHRSILRGFFKYLYHNGRLKRNLAPLIIGPTIFAQSRPPKFLRSREIERLFKSLSDTTPVDFRRAAIVHIGFSLGLRPKEISQVRLDDIMFEKREICVPDRKNATPTKLPLPEMTIMAIAAYILEERPKTESRRLFIRRVAPYQSVRPTTVTNEITFAMKEAGLSSSAYWLRHTYAQNLLEADMSIFEIKEMMGHDSLQTTQRYLHIHIKLMRKVLFNED